MDPHTERQNILKVIERLEAQFPLVSRDRIENLVEFEYAQFVGRPVRQYISILVEHVAKSRLLKDAAVLVAA
ncbi:hypothetical protein GY21_19365 [Cryobacterium roopkundense]|uniref:Uncharacterized protein n=1 Tax=Cryobacterium roopkundense TaxID=1001240 RepID=A0A099J322_9MICO|nr:hypothetical protein [Cryobacterium roopkundense]KGJ71848.1 hypothetical protein GY21_19365 [Cryobacterium roopkundense]MBB5641411.1 hypothetical protein [Cryobacterium roopkundense]